MLSNFDWMQTQRGKERRMLLRAYGAEVVVTPTDAGPDDPRSYYQVAERLAKAIPGGYRPRS